MQLRTSDTVLPAQPGRSCPLNYRYSPASLARHPDIHAETLYVVGGLYGNVHALERILEIVHAEPQRALIVFNGDFHWFDVHLCDFAVVDWIVMQHIALRGNVESEIAGDDDSAGCGCAYPSDVTRDEVERSNAIARLLRCTARRFPGIRSGLDSLQMNAVAQVAGVRVAIVHGDAESLAGWGYSHQALLHAEGAQRLIEHFSASRTRVIASSHTCLPVAQTVQTLGATCALFNNGAAGMPNFRGTTYGLLTRISTRSHPHALYRTRVDSVYVEAIAIDYDHMAWRHMFLASWPPGSPAYESYYERIMEGPRYEIHAAVRGAVRLCNNQH
ncbi:MAG: hypothetical protein ACT4PS_16515 [Betaproteobacteria bacterium]